MKKTILISLLLSFTATVQGALVFEEVFNYTPGGGGTGAGSAWDSLSSNGWTKSTGGANFNLLAGGTNFTAPTLSPFGYSFSEMQVGGNGMDMEKNFGTTIGNTYFFSYTFETWSSVAEGTASGTVRFQTESGQSFRLGYEGDDTFGIGIGGTDSTAQASLANSTTYFVVGKFSVTDNLGTNTGTTWDISANLYAETAGTNILAYSSLPSTEPGSWTFTATGGTGVDNQIVEEISLRASGGPNLLFESIRVGESYAEVAVPEPSTYALLAGFATLGLVMLRRRMK
ncbi:MAG: PEP-CTERM sorting domain-containing protein [Puniceicoccaceae bacterium]